MADPGPVPRGLVATAHLWMLDAGLLVAAANEE